MLSQMSFWNGAPQVYIVVSGNDHDLFANDALYRRLQLSKMKYEIYSKILSKPRTSLKPEGALMEM